MKVLIRKACQDDEAALALVQTESRKSAFAGILTAETLERSTDYDRVKSMYARTLEARLGTGYLMTLDDSRLMQSLDGMRQETPGTTERPSSSASTVFQRTGVRVAAAG